MNKNRRTAFVTVLALLGGMQPREPGPVSPNACPMCGRTGKFDTGECSFCGVYKCKTCEKHHLGNPAQPCNGMGVDIPGAT